MKLISHRGNLHGPRPELENLPSYILEAEYAGYDVEIDVWFVDGRFYLGHDAPTHVIHKDFLLDAGLWCHAKNLPALVEMLKTPNIHCFWHQEDDVVLTSQKYIWTYPGKTIAEYNAIAVCPERVVNWDISKAEGICSDYIANNKRW